MTMSFSYLLLLQSQCLESVSFVSIFGMSFLCLQITMYDKCPFYSLCPYQRFITPSSLVIPRMYYR